MIPTTRLSLLPKDKRGVEMPEARHPFRNEAFPLPLAGEGQGEGGSENGGARLVGEQPTREREPDTDDRASP